MKAKLSLKFAFLAILFFMASASFAQGEKDRLKELMIKETSLKNQGADLTQLERSEYDSLVQKIGIIDASSMLDEILKANNEQRSAGIDKIVPQIQKAPTLADQIAQAQAQAQSKSSQGAVVTKGTNAPAESAKSLPATETTPPLSQAEMEAAAQKAQIVLQVLKAAEEDAKNKQLAEEEAKKKDIADKSQKAPPTIDNPDYSPEEMRKMVKKYSDVAERSAEDTIASSIATKLPAKKGSIATPESAQPIVGRDVAREYMGKSPIYEPAPRDGVSNPGFMVDVNAVDIIHKTISPNDTISVKMCIDSPITFYLEGKGPDDNTMTLQEAIVDNPKVFAAKTFNGGRSVLLRQIYSIKAGTVESKLRLVRQKDGMVYIIRVYGKPCPEGKIVWPSQIYLKEKTRIIADQNTMIAPEDAIIEATNMYDRDNTEQVSPYFLTMNSSAYCVMNPKGNEKEKGAVAYGDCVALSVEMRSPVPVKNYEFKVMDFLQINKIPSRSTFLEQSSKFASKGGGNVYRNSILLIINKTYIFEKRYIYLLFLNHDRKTYQKIEVDLLKQYKTSKDIGLEG